MRAKALLAQGARTVSPLNYHRDSPKVSGYMWEGSLTLERSNVLYRFDMRYHGGDEMTESEALDHVSLKGITYQGVFYDTYWHTIMTEDEIWLQPQGWFGHDNEQLERAVGAIKRANYNFDRDVLTDEQRQVLLKLGFIRTAP